MKLENQSSLSSCNIHPIESIEGVCPLCLNERLLVLASLQRLRPSSPSPSYHTIKEPKTILRNSSKKKNIRLFSFFGFFELRHHKSNHQTTSIISPEDSFISIKFEENGATSWEKGNARSELEHCKASWDHHVMVHTKKQEIIAHPKPRLLLTWTKRISRLVHVISFRSGLAHATYRPKSKVMMT
ncbi:hypothetical protein AALP_AA4G090900 [Arabis alpina]|uniref:Uncharacterized protein n=1 Tax=Arabis alpina TaxID=50452 RepID=A0A087H249_ARAAL|nr:hypothetical protein AALP_AA4G090900 [Arabis alpina]